MAEQADDEVKLKHKIEVVEGEEPDETTEVRAEDDEGKAEAEPEVEISFGDGGTPTPPEQDTGLVRKLRAEIRKRDEELAQHRQTSQPKPVDVDEKPTLEGCDYDGDRFETELLAWKERSAEAEKATEQARKDAEAAQATWAEEMAGYGRRRDALKLPDFEDAEAEVVAGLSQIQQAILVKHPKGAELIYALGKHPDRIKALAANKDPVKFAFATEQLAGGLKVTNRKQAPEPERVVRGSAPLSKATDKELERLEAEALKTGDRTKVQQYKRQKSRATS